MPDETIALSLNGRETRPELPPLLRPAARSAGATDDDDFLPAGYLQAVSAYDVGTTARSAPGGVSARQHDAAADEIIVLELADGSTFITSAQRLRDTLRRTQPGLIGANGEILLEKLRSEGASPRGFMSDAVGGLVSKVFTLAVQSSGDTLLAEAAQALADAGVSDATQLGVSWLGTKALMAAIESHLKQPPGLYRWVGASGTAADLEPVAFDLKAPPVPDPKPMLVFVHGTGSSSLSSFGDLRSGDRDLWAALERRFTGGILAFEHRTLSQSPITNAIDLANALPRGAHVNLVSHSRGGLVADLLCLGGFDDLIAQYRHDLDGSGDADAAESKRVVAELDTAHAEHRAALHVLAQTLRERQIVVQRYVRTAAPAHGTLLASANFDLFLSGLLTLIGQVPFFFGSPFYSMFKRVVIEIAKNRTNPHLVPGIEAMLPTSPMARLLRDAPVREGLVMSVIAGDIEGGNMLKRLGVLLSDFLLFDNTDNDLVVDTAAMLAGIAPQAGAKVLFDRGADVSHFRYFTNIDTRAALRDWLVHEQPTTLDAFRALPSPGEYAAALAAASTRDATAADRPVVVVLPGVMGSHLKRDASDRVWFDPVDIATGGLAKIAFGQQGVEADELFAMFYGKVCQELARSHRVEPFPYDWRQPLDVLAERLGQFLDRLLKETDQPIRLLAHSMGGLVVRACIHKRRPVMDALMKRDGARLVMLGTPHQGAHSMVENLIGKGDTLRTLVRLDLTHDMQQVLDIVAGFRGPLTLLPKPGFKDIFQGQPDGGGLYDYQKAETWSTFKSQVSDFWFGNGRCGTPAQDVLDAASWLWAADGATRPTLPPEYESKSVYVFGVARNTPCGIREEGGRLKMVGTTRGDGTVTWESGRIGGIGQFFYMPAEHGDLPSTPEHFPALTELLTTGATSRLATAPPALRAIEQPRPVSYDAGPPTADDADALQRSLLGGSLRNRVPPRPKRRLEVAVKAMDLRFLSQPILVGHYEQDPIAGPQALIDRELLDRDLSERHSLGLYAGPRGTATVVLRVPNEFERRRGSLRGAVVVGLGPYDGAISLANLTEAVRAGVLRYLLQVIDVLGKDDREVPLATLLLGYNSSANLTVGASVEALVRGVMEANAKFFETTRLNIRVAKLDIVELYIDTAITAVYALRHLGARLASQGERQGTALVVRPELERGEGARQRLFDNQNMAYWPRLVVTDADGDGKDCVDPGVPTKLADRLRFLYVGSRARAESVVQQRQPGLVEKLVRQQIGTPVWQEDFGRMLFQLMVPNDFKEAARQLDRVVLVVDATTANLPWELMLADDPSRKDDDKRPLAVRLAVVRQLSSSRFRRQVRQGIERSALVVGNPSSEGFAIAFPGTPDRPNGKPPALPGAEAEAIAVAGVLKGLGYAVEQVVGEEAPAKDVLAALYRKPYRLLHLSAHGVFNLMHADGRARSGVVLSDGLLITAAEIDAMETVPEVVFLNCCHLGQVDIGREGNKLAASVSRELIEIGVRCVVVAGWAVSDDKAQRFGEAFYEHLLLRRRPFGDAVFEARKVVWELDRSDITWGAFQAYGDPGWLAEPRADDGGGPGADGTYASPDELLDDLARLRADQSRKRDHQSDREARAQVATIEQTLKSRCPPGWLSMPQLQSALGATWYDLGQFDKARTAYLAAVQAEDKVGQVPIKDIERLANIEARLGERMASADGAGKPGQQSGEAMIRLALQRLAGLDALVSARAGDAPDAAALVNVERHALRGSAYKRLASVYAKRMLAGSLDAAAHKHAGAAMAAALADAVQAYGVAEGSPGSSHFSPYLALNRLALDALTPWADVAQHEAALALAHQCQQLADADQSDFWAAVMQPEAVLVERLLDGTLAATGDAGASVFAEVSRAYAQALSNVTVKPPQIDSVVTQVELLARFGQALSTVDADAGRAEMLQRLAQRLLDLAQQLQPGRRRPSDVPAAVAPPVAKVAAKKAARKTVARKARPDKP